MTQRSQSSWYNMVALQSMVRGEEEEKKRSQRLKFITTLQLWCLIIVIISDDI